MDYEENRLQERSCLHLMVLCMQGVCFTLFLEPPMKTALSTLVLSLATLVSTSSFASSSINKSEQLYRVLAQSGLRAEVTFEGETAFTAYDLSCTTTSEVPAKVSCSHLRRPERVWPEVPRPPPLLLAGIAPSGPG